MKKAILFVGVSMCLCVTASWTLALAGEAVDWTWGELPSLPNEQGVAGAFVGVHNGALLVAGGANFPDGPAWRGGKKVWHDDVFGMEEEQAGSAWVKSTAFRLPRPLAYGVSISTENGVLCVGGCDADRCYADVFLLQWNPADRTVSVKELPSLPRPLAMMTGARVGGAVYVAGGQETVTDAVATHDFFVLDLMQAERGWRELPPWPGPPRVLAMSVGQSDGVGSRFFLFGGRTQDPDTLLEVHSDAYKFNPGSAAWDPIANIGSGLGSDMPLMAATAMPVGTSHILLLGGTVGVTTRELDHLNREIAQARTDQAKAELTDRRIAVFEGPPGFNKELLLYHTVADTWSDAGPFPDPVPVTTTAVRWQDRIVIPSGEIRPCVRTPAVHSLRLEFKPAFGALNYTVLGIYLGILVAMGAYFSRREDTTEDFFKAGGRIPWWAAGLSIFGTQLSAITFIAIPAKTYTSDWRYLMLNMSIILVAPLIVLLYLPFYRRLNVTTAYEYLERRFNLASRLIGSAMFVLLQLGRIGIVLFLPSIALSLVTGMDVRICILLMGVLSILYTVMGGIEVVVWTDVMQVVVLLGGALIAVVVIVLNVEGGLPAIIGTAAAAGKFHAFDLAFDFTQPTLWVVVFGGLGANLVSYGSDQSVIQRYLTTHDERGAAKGIWTNAALTLPASLLFFFIGTALFAFYRAHPAAANPALEQGDAVFPWFIISQLPAGLSGLLIAAVFAASMSSLDSSMNSVATAVTTDWYRRFKPAAADHRCLLLARWVTVIVGGVGTVLALMMAAWDIKSLWDQFSTVIGLFAGGLGGLFLLGMLSRRANGAGAVAGLVASGVVQYFVKVHTPIHLLLYGCTGPVACVVVGYVVSVLTGGFRKDIGGLTVFDSGTGLLCASRCTATDGLSALSSMHNSHS